MNTKKTYVAVGAIGIVIFNVLFFLFKPSELHSGAWISFVSINIALVVLTLLPIVEGDYSRANMKYSTVFLALILCIVTLVVGIGIIAINPEGAKWAIAIHVVFFGIFAALLLTNKTANDVTESAVQEIEAGRDYTRGLARNIKTLSNYTNDSEINKRIEKLYDIIHSSPVRSNEAARQLESELFIAVEDLKMNLSSLPTDKAITEIEMIIEMANERNEIVRR